MILRAVLGHQQTKHKVHYASGQALRKRPFRPPPTIQERKPNQRPSRVPVVVDSTVCLLMNVQQCEFAGRLMHREREGERLRRGA